MDQLLDRNAKNFIRPDLKTYCEQNIIRLYEEKYQSIYKDNYNSQSALEFDILENEMIKLLEKKDRTQTEEQLLESYKNYIIKYLNQYPEMFITSKLITKDNISRIFFKKDYEKVKKYRENYYKEALQLYTRYIRKEPLTKGEEKRLFCYFQATIGEVNTPNMQNAQKLLVREVLRRNQVDLTGKKYLIDYFTHRKCQRKNLPVAKVYIGNKTTYNDPMGNAYGMSIADTGTICIKESFLKEPGKNKDKKYNLTNNTLLIHVINHELEHFSDSHDYSNDKITIGAWKMLKNRLLRNYLSTEDFNEYLANYNYKESERTANKWGYRETESILLEFLPKEEIEEDINELNNRRKETDYGIAEAYQMDSKKMPETLEKYNIENLENIVFSNKELVKKHRLLQLFFETNGRRKSTENIIREYTGLLTNQQIDKDQKRNYSEIYSEIFDYIFQTTDLELFSISNLSKEEQIVWYKEIKNSYERECRRLKQMMDIYQPNKNRQFDFIAEKRIERIRKYYDYLTAREDITEELTTINAKREKRIYPVLQLRKEKLREDVESFQDRIDYWNMEVSQGSKLAQEIKSLSEIATSTQTSTPKKI